MPPQYAPLTAEPSQHSASDSDPPVPTRSLLLRPPPFEIPDPFAPFTRSRPSLDSTDSSSESDGDGEEEEYNEKVDLMREVEDPEDGTAWRERKQAQNNVSTP